MHLPGTDENHDTIQREDGRGKNCFFGICWSVFVSQSVAGGENGKGQKVPCIRIY